MTQLHNNITPCSRPSMVASYILLGKKIHGGLLEVPSLVEVYIASLYIAIVLNGWRD